MALSQAPLLQGHSSFIKAFQDEISTRIGFSVCLAIGLAFQITGFYGKFMIVGSGILPQQTSCSSRAISMSVCNFYKIVFEGPG